MRYKRQEAFRYVFGDPIPVLFKLTEVNGSQVESGNGQAHILDLSLKGMRIQSKLDLLHSKQDKIAVSLHFSLHVKEDVEQKFILNGHLVWKEKHFDGFLYGLTLDIEKEKQQVLMDTLKEMSKTTQK
ncbi:PilZ domain-containing protein [Bacillus weihaiensis]|uniref:PilZ domain-containing protein n=1 Tax=Bacillus weihaiensis TaxID=1547283 RepID=UPI002357432A|nr:PilZ domain-containing protein [Bacillus weihaiensis]